MSDRQKQKQQYIVLKQKYVGLGKENTTKEEWLENVQRDTYNNLQGHSAMLEYIALAEFSTSKRSTRIELIKKMSQVKIRSKDD